MTAAVSSAVPTPFDQGLLGGDHEAVSRGAEPVGHPRLHERDRLLGPARDLFQHWFTEPL